jgi:hypothetical protein
MTAVDSDDGEYKSKKKETRTLHICTSERTKKEEWTGLDVVTLCWVYVIWSMIFFFSKLIWKHHREVTREQLMGIALPLRRGIILRAVRQRVPIVFLYSDPVILSLLPYINVRNAYLIMHHIVSTYNGSKIKTLDSRERALCTYYAQRVRRSIHL